MVEDQHRRWTRSQYYIHDHHGSYVVVVLSPRRPRSKNVAAPSMPQANEAIVQTRRVAQGRFSVEIKTSLNDVVTQPLPMETRQRAGACVIQVSSPNFFFDGAHTLVYLADITVEREDEREGP